jgi:aminocarboxymuconate-semialdehyde decarboxylase
MAGALAIDVHAHFFPERFLKAIEEAGPESGGTIDRSNAIGPAIVTPTGRTAPLEVRYYDVDRRLRSMDRQGVQAQALSLTAPMVYWADAALGRRLAGAFNDAASEVHVAYPDRFVVCATLPMQDPAAAVAELDRAAALPGVRGVYLGTNVKGRDLSDPAFTPVFARCEALRLPVLLHPLTVIGASDRLRPFYLANLLGNPFDTAVAAAHLAFGGVLDRFPRLQICLPHAGGAFPYLVGRLRRGQRVRPEAREGARRPVTAYLRRFTYDTISHSPEALRYLVSIVGVDRVMVGSDFCFDMGYERPRDIVAALRLPRPQQTRVLRGNAARLLRLT